MAFWVVWFGGCRGCSFHPAVLSSTAGALRVLRAGVQRAVLPPVWRQLHQSGGRGSTGAAWL